MRHTIADLLRLFAKEERVIRQLIPQEIKEEYHQD